MGDGFLRTGHRWLLRFSVVDGGAGRRAGTDLTHGACRRAGAAGRWFGARRQRRHVVHADRDRQRQPRQPDRLHLRALRRSGSAGGRRGGRGQRRARHHGRGQRRPRLRGDPVRPAEGHAAQQRRRLPDRRPRPRPRHRRCRVQARPDHRLLLRRRLGTRPGARHDRQPGVWSAGRLRGAGHGQQPAGRHDPRRVRRRPADLRRQVHPVAHPGGRHVDQHPAGRHRRQEPARIGVRSRRMRRRPRSALLAGPDRLEHGRDPPTSRCRRVRVPRRRRAAAAA